MSVNHQVSTLPAKTDSYTADIKTVLLLTSKEKLSEVGVGWIVRLCLHSSYGDQRSFKCLLRSLATLLFEARSLSEPPAHHFGWASQ